MVKFWNWIERKLWIIFGITVLGLILMFANGCHEYEQREATRIDHAITLLENLQTVNTVSTPFNPYAIPIGVGLTGLIAMLEALRRKEKGGRKYAEHELKNNNNKNNHK